MTGESQVEEPRTRRVRSEFGRGYAICLLMFAFHESRIEEQTDLYATMRAKEPDMFSEDRACEMWANGSSDHLYDLIRPRRSVTADEWRRAKALQERALDVGHGFGRERSSATPAEMHALCGEARSLVAAAALRARTDKPLTFEGAWALDLALGITPVRGDSATCEQPIPLRQPQEAKDTRGGEQ